MQRCCSFASMSRRVPCRCCWNGRGAWWRRASWKCWKTSRRRECPRRNSLEESAPPRNESLSLKEEGPVAKPSSQKFIARNRAPRVQIEYEVELYGAQKKVQVAFVMGVLSDLSGEPAEPLAPVDERRFLAIDIDNFD